VRIPKTRSDTIFISPSSCINKTRVVLYSPASGPIHQLDPHLHTASAVQNHNCVGRLRMSTESCQPRETAYHVPCCAIQMFQKFMLLDRHVKLEWRMCTLIMPVFLSSSYLTLLPFVISTTCKFMTALIYLLPNLQSMSRQQGMWWCLQRWRPEGLQVLAFTEMRHQLIWTFIYIVFARTRNEFC
jgi:hypothetical protein